MKPTLLIPALIAGLSLHASQPMQEFRLPNGLRVLLAENHERPLVRLELRAAWDPAEEPPGKEGMGGFLGQMLHVGRVGSLPRESFQKLLEDRALRYSFVMHPRQFAWSILSDSQGQDGAFEALALAATRAEVDGAQVELRRQRFIQSFKEWSPRQRAEAAFARAIDLPPSAMLPTESSINRIEVSDLGILMRRVLRPERSILVLQGDMNLSQARQLAMLHLGAWGPGPQEPVPPVSVPLPGKARATRTWAVKEPGMPVEIRVGAGIPSRPALHPSTMEVLRHLVAQEVKHAGPSGVEGLDLRVSTSGAWTATARVVQGGSVVEAVRAVQGLLDRLRGKKIEERELAEACRAWQSERTLRALHPQRDVEGLAEAALAQEPLNDRTCELKAADLQAVLQLLFDQGRTAYCLVGEVRDEISRLEALGLGPVETVN